VGHEQVHFGAKAEDLRRSIGQRRCRPGRANCGFRMACYARTVKEPLDSAGVRRLIREVLGSGEVRFSRHALEEMRKDQLSEVDCVNVLRGGAVGQAGFENGSRRYPVRGSRVTVVVAFRSQDKLVVVTAWRHRR
jgi:hypothetical protein